LGYALSSPHIKVPDIATQTIQVIDRLDSPSADHFMNVKLPSPAKYDEFKALLSNPAALESKLSATRAALKPIDALLLDENTGPYLHGDEPGHADFVLFGEYAFARVCPELKKEVWESDELKGIKGWVERLLNGGLVDKKLLA
jgi:glutathione S-transferase